MNTNALIRCAAALFLSLIIAVFPSVVASAESDISATVESKSEVFRGDEIEFCVNINGGQGIRAIAVIPDFNSESFALVSGKWIAEGVVSDFSIAEGNGVIAFDQPTDLDGAILTFTLLTREDAPLTTETVSARVVFHCGGEEIEITSTSAAVEIKCDHGEISSWAQDAEKHWQECSCGYKTDSAPHTWNSGSVTKEPTQSLEGEKRYRCTVCGAERAEIIAKLEKAPTNVGAIVAICIGSLAACALIAFLLINRGKTPPPDKTDNKEEKATYSKTESSFEYMEEPVTKEIKEDEEIHSEGDTPEALDDAEPKNTEKATDLDLADEGLAEVGADKNSIDNAPKENVEESEAPTLADEGLAGVGADKNSADNAPKENVEEREAPTFAEEDHTEEVASVEAEKNDAHAIDPKEETKGTHIESADEHLDAIVKKEQVSGVSTEISTDLDCEAQKAEEDGEDRPNESRSETEGGSAPIEGLERDGENTLS